MGTRGSVRIVWEGLRILLGIAVTLPFALVGFMVAVVEDGYALGQLAYKSAFKWWEE